MTSTRAVCAVCDNITERKCPDCKRVYYCSIECEEKDRIPHKEGSCSAEKSSLPNLVQKFLTETNIYKQLAIWYSFIPITETSHPYLTIYLHGQFWGGEGPTKVFVGLTRCTRSDLCQAVKICFPNYPIKSDMDLIPFFKVVRSVRMDDRLIDQRIFNSFIRIPEQILRSYRENEKLQSSFAVLMEDFVEGRLLLRFHNGSFVDSRSVQDFVIPIPNAKK